MTNPVVPTVPTMPIMPGTLTAPTMPRPSFGQAAPVVGYLPAYGGNPSRYIVMASAAASLAVLVGGCNPPQPAQRSSAASGSASAPAPVTSNQSDCTPAATDEFCRHMLGTERRVENMRTGRDEYNSHEQGVFWLGGILGVLGLAVLIGSGFGVRAIVRKVRRKPQAKTQEPPPPAPDNAAPARPKRWWPRRQPPATSEGTKKPGDK